MEKDYTNLYLLRYYFPDGGSEGVALTAANSAEEASNLLSTTGDLKDYRIEITEIRIVPGAHYEGNPVLIKEYLIKTN